MLHQILSSKRKNTIPRDNSFRHHQYAHWFYSGNWKFYDEKGKLIIERNYQSGKLVWNNLEINLKKNKMQQLTKAEEQLMEQLWKLEKALWKIYFRLSEPNQNDNGCHFTEEDDR
jgi:hypothetical protein